MCWHLPASKALLLYLLQAITSANRSATAVCVSHDSLTFFSRVYEVSDASIIQVRSPQTMSIHGNHSEGRTFTVEEGIHSEVNYLDNRVCFIARVSSDMFDLDRFTNQNWTIVALNNRVLIPSYTKLWFSILHNFFLRYRTMNNNSLFSRTNRQFHRLRVSLNQSRGFQL